jgi:hypothetical protein
MNMDAFNALSEGEKFVVEWQYHMAGDFARCLAEAIALADNSNLEKLAKGFPREVESMQKFYRIDGWWKNVVSKLQGV